jgi:simple sugar transport system permease protein
MTSTQQVERPLVAGAPARSTARQGGIASRLLQARAFGALAVIIVLGIIFQIMSGVFISTDEISGIFVVASSLAIMGIGVSFLMISGEFDLSVGSMFAITPIVMGLLMTNDNWPTLPAFFVAMLIPLAFGLIHGTITTRFGIPSFITTLGSYFLLDGVAYIATGGQPVLFTGHNEFFSLIGGPVGFAGLTAPVFWMLGLTLLLSAVLNLTAFGNWSFAAGGRAGIGRSLGVPTARVKTVNFCMCALLAGFAGCTSFANVGSMAPGSGSTLNLMAIVAAVLGGTSLFGIEGSIVGTMFGAIIIGELETGLVLVGAPGELYEAMIGGILVVAVLVNLRLKGIGAALERLTARR